MTIHAPILNEALINYIKEMAKAYKRGELGIFVGSGISNPCGIPTWKALVDRLILGMGQWDPDYKAEFDKITSQQTPESDDELKKLNDEFIAYVRQGLSTELAVAAYVKNHLNSIDVPLPAVLYPVLYNTSYNRSKPLKEQLIKPIHQNIHRHLVLLTKQQPGMIWTINYDNLIEDAAEKLKVTYNTLQSEADRDTNNLIIAHLHGFLRFGLSEDELKKVSPNLALTLGEDDYYQFASENMGWANLEFLRLFMKYRVLLLGMSLEDINLRRILSATHKMVRPGSVSPWHFALMRNVDFKDEELKKIRPANKKALMEKASNKRISYWKKYGLQILEYPDHDYLPTIIYRLRYETYSDNGENLWQKGYSLGYGKINPWTIHAQDYASKELNDIFNRVKNDLKEGGDELVEMGIFLIMEGGEKIELVFRVGTERKAEHNEKIFSINPDRPTGMAGRVFVAGAGARVPRDNELHDYGLDENEKTSRSKYEGIISIPIIDWPVGGIPLGVIYITISTLGGKLFKNGPDKKPVVNFEELFEFLNTSAVILLRHLAGRPLDGFK